VAATSAAAQGAASSGTAASPSPCTQLDGRHRPARQPEAPTLQDMR
jgi:hypothetical protein